MCNVNCEGKHSPTKETLKNLASNLKKRDAQQNALLFVKGICGCPPPQKKRGGNYGEKIGGGGGGGGAVVRGSRVEWGAKLNSLNEN